MRIVSSSECSRFAVSRVKQILDVSITEKYNMVLNIFYHLNIPTGYFLENMIAENQKLELDMDNIPNF